MATSEGIPSSIDIEFLELNDNPYFKVDYFSQFVKVNALYLFHEITLLVIKANLKQVYSLDIDYSHVPCM